MYKCERCDKVFKEPGIARGEYHSEVPGGAYEPDKAVCPICNSDDIYEGAYCSSCGKFINIENFDDEHSLCCGCKEHAIETFYMLQAMLQKAIGEPKYKFLKKEGYID